MKKTLIEMTAEMLTADYADAYKLATGEKYFRFKRGKLTKEKIDAHILERVRYGGLGPKVKEYYTAYLKTMCH